MRCEACQGTGVLLCQIGRTVEIHEPCPVCVGLREVNCCDGICEQPEKDDGGENICPIAINAAGWAEAAFDRPDNYLDDENLAFAAIYPPPK